MVELRRESTRRELERGTRGAEGAESEFCSRSARWREVERETRGAEKGDPRRELSKGLSSAESRRRFNMFKRPHTAKTSSPLRSSDVRKLREELQTAFVLSPALAKSLLPDGLLVQKATNHLEEPLTIYSAPNGDPRFFRPGKGNDGALIPTCYTFDLVPELLPVLVTAPQVVENLVSGAGTFRCFHYTSSARMTSR